MTNDEWNWRWRPISFVSATLVASGCGKADTTTQAASETRLFDGKVTLTIPAGWREQRRVNNESVNLIQWEVPDKSTEATSDSANATITVEPIQTGVSVTNFGNSRLPTLTPEQGFVVLTDLIVDAKWRSTLSLGHQDSTPYTIMDRFGVDNGVMVAVRLAHPVLSNNGAEVSQSVSNFNLVVASLKIGGSNSVDSEMRIDNGTVWLRSFKDVQTNWMSGTGAVYRRFQAEQSR